MNRSEKIGELACALLAFQAEVKGASRSAINPHFRSQYSTLADVWDVARPVLGAHGLSIVQGAGRPDERGIVVSTLLLHVSGEWIESELLIPLEKPTAQSAGSAISYGRRYGLMAMLGIVADDDDDGNAATAAAPTTPVRRLSDLQKEQQ